MSHPMEPDEQIIYINENDIQVGDEIVLGESSLMTFQVVPANIEVFDETDKQTDEAPIDQESVTSPKRLISQSNDKTEQLKFKVKSRKKPRNSANWKSSIRKAKYQAGQEYVSMRGKVVPKKNIKNTKNCLKDCKYLCATKVMEIERKEQFDAFYSLDAQRKSDFILKTTERHLKARPTKKSPSRRTFTFSYYMDAAGTRFSVCKNFYLDTYHISQTPVYNAHKNKCDATGTAQQNMRGRANTKKIPDEKVTEIMNHINSFPRVESHYCRAKTGRQYLEPNLNITKMYELYKDMTSDPVKETFYRYIFCTKFDIAFHVPKSDRCGACEKYKVAQEQYLLTDDMAAERERHIKLKTEMREQKSRDKESPIPVLCFDLQNVLNCPRAEIGPLFYYSKLNIYNLTAYLLPAKKTYCCIWTEHCAGRSGNDIASAFANILNRVLEDYPEFNDIITWSDSCVPQNKNSIISTAVLEILKSHPNLNSVTMKYSIAGHGAVQEVDKIHSDIEKVLAVNEYFSPMGLIRLLKTVNRKNRPIIMQMNSNDFKDYTSYGKMYYDFTAVPFTKFRIVKFSQQFFELQYSFDYEESNFVNINIRRKERSKKIMPARLAEPEVLKTNIELSDIKKKHLQEMFVYMCPADIKYYKVILKLKDQDPSPQESLKDNNRLQESSTSKLPLIPKQNKRTNKTKDPSIQDAKIKKRKANPKLTM